MQATDEPPNELAHMPPRRSRRTSVSSAGEDTYGGQTASYWRTLLLETGHFTAKRLLDGLSAKQLCHISEALVSAAKPTGTLGKAQRQVALSERWALEAEERVRLCEEEMALLAQEHDARATAHAYEREMLRLESGRAAENDRELAHVRGLWAGAAAQNVELTRRLDASDLEGREEVARIRGQLSSLHSMLEEELRAALMHFRVEYRDAAFEALDEEAQGAIIQSYQMKRAADAMNDHARQLQADQDRMKAKAREDALAVANALSVQRQQAAKIIWLRRRLREATESLEAEYAWALSQNTAEAEKAAAALWEELQAEKSKSTRLMHEYAIVLTSQRRWQHQAKRLRHQRREWQRAALTLRFGSEALHLSGMGSAADLLLGSQLHAPQLDGSQVGGSQVDGSQIGGSQVDGSQVDGSVGLAPGIAPMFGRIGSKDALTGAFSCVSVRSEKVPSACHPSAAATATDWAEMWRAPQAGGSNQRGSGIADPMGGPNPGSAVETGSAFDPASPALPAGPRPANLADAAAESTWGSSSTSVQAPVPVPVPVPLPAGCYAAAPGSDPFLASGGGNLRPQPQGFEGSGGGSGGGSDYLTEIESRAIGAFRKAVAEAGISLDAPFETAFAPNAVALDAIGVAGGGGDGGGSGSGGGEVGGSKVVSGKGHGDSSAGGGVGGDAVASSLLRLCAVYLLCAKHRQGALDPVAAFHLRNGASLAALHWGANPSARGLRESAGIMVRIHPRHQLLPAQPVPPVSTLGHTGTHWHTPTLPTLTATPTPTPATAPTHPPTNPPHPHLTPTPSPPSPLPHPVSPTPCP